MTRVSVPRIARYAPVDLAAYLVGEWSLEREIHDARSGELLRFSGGANVLRLDDSILGYEERGAVTFGTTTLEAHRSYRYELLGGSRAQVNFPDGGPFHHLDLSHGADRFRHDCGEDVYSGVTITETDTWWTRWRVAGPLKDYVSTTRAERVTDASAPDASPTSSI